MTSLGATGLFGKVAAHADFVRVRAGDPAAQALARWLEEGSEAVGRARPAAGAAPARFLFAAPAAPRAVVGALASSADAVGRKFPFAAFAAADAREVAQTFPALPAAARPFLEAACAVVGAAARLDAADLASRVEALPALGTAALAGAHAELAASAGHRGARAFLERACGGVDGGQPLYALYCFRIACAPLRGRGPAPAGVVLDCPAHDDLDRFVWLELARRLLGWDRPPGFLWTEGAPGRLLVALGAPPPAALAALWGAPQRDGRIWPLTTEKSDALEAARKALGPSVLGVLARPDASVADLLNCLEP